MNRSALLTLLPSALVLALALSACSQKEAPAPSPRPVVAMPAAADDILPRWSLPGQIDARYTTPLSFRVSGKIIERRVRLGDTVSAGQAVARVDAADASKSADSAKAQVAAAQAQLDFSKRQWDRDRAQSKENLISAAQLEQSQNAYAVALAQRNQLAQQAGLAGNQLLYTSLIVEHAGIITAELADTGQNVTAGQAVYNLAWSGDIDAVCDVPENILNGLTIGQRANVTVGSLPGKTFVATLRELSPAADPQSRSFRAKFTIANPSPELRLGLTANIAFEQTAGLSTEPTFTLPATALFHEGPEPALWIVKAPENTLELRPVKVLRYDARTITVSSGLKAGERVVWQGVHTVAAGQQVRPIGPLHPEDVAS